LLTFEVLFHTTFQDPNLNIASGIRANAMFVLLTTESLRSSKLEWSLVSWRSQ